MSPAFSSTRQAAGFALLLLLILLLPLLMRAAWLPPREEMYSSLSWGTGDYPYLDDQIFREKGDIDIALMGNSRIWWGVDTPQVETQLSAKLGRPAVVRTLAWGHGGFDPLYFHMKDLLEHRKVHMIVFNDLIPASGNTAHNRAPFYFRLSENAAELAGLPLRTQASFYASAILGMPRILLSMLRHNLPIIPSKVVSTGPFTNMASPALRLGSLAVPVVFGQTIRPDMPQTCASPADVCVYSEATKQSFHFSTDPIWPMQAPFARKIAALAKAHHVELVCLHMPTMDETNSSVIEESAYWPDFCQGNVSIIGIPPDKLFRGMKEQGTLKLFYNLEHLNQNGQEYFTKLITPSLVQLYENKINP